MSFHHQIFLILLFLIILRGWTVMRWREWRRERSKARYRKLLRKPLWRRRRFEIKERDGWACVVCGDWRRLEVHHKRYRRARFLLFFSRLRKPWKYRDDELETLCHRCHEARHFNRGSPRVA